MQYIIKIIITTILVISASEVAKRFPALGALIIALPLTSIIAMNFLYYDTRDAVKVAEFSRSIPPVIVPSIIFFYAFSFLIDKNFTFAVAMSSALLLMLCAYGIYLFFVTRIGL